MKELGVVILASGVAAVIIGGIWCGNGKLCVGVTI
jgi:hypothetical protein